MWPFKKKPPVIHKVEAIDGKAIYYDSWKNVIGTLTRKTTYFWVDQLYIEPGIDRIKEYLNNNRTILKTDDEKVMLPLHRVHSIEIQEIPVTLEIKED